jgi:hypothetical protein
MGTEIIQVRPDPRSDPDGSRMSRFLAAHLLLERAVARRVLLVHLVALIGGPFFLCAAIPSLHGGLRLTLALFGVALLAALWAVYDENVHRIAAGRAAVGVDVTTLDPPGRIVP